MQNNFSPLEKRKKQLKKWYQKNKEEIKIKSNIYYHKNKDIISIKNKNKVKNLSDAEKLKRTLLRKKYRVENKDMIFKRTQTNHYKFMHYKQSAKDRWYCFLLSEDLFSHIFNSSCFYCWENTARWIDRVDNNTWYTEQNCVPCCSVCNKMKLNYDNNFFINHIKKIYEKLI